MPAPSLTVYAVIAILITFFGKGVDDVLSFSMFLDCFGMSTSVSALFILRKRRENYELVNKGMLTVILPILILLFVETYVLIATAVVIDKPYAAYNRHATAQLVFSYLFYYSPKKIMLPR
ncbi:MAG: hypothetical protein QM751_16145 [Paludibacteraceae bacterium]